MLKLKAVNKLSFCYLQEKVLTGKQEVGETNWLLKRRTRTVPRRWVQRGRRFLSLWKEAEEHKTVQNTSNRLRRHVCLHSCSRKLVPSWWHHEHGELWLVEDHRVRIPDFNVTPWPAQSGPGVGVSCSTGMTDRPSNSNHRRRGLEDRLTWCETHITHRHLTWF